MSKRGVAIEELVERARAGQQTALAELLDWLAEDMHSAAEVELKTLNSRRDPHEVWEAARHEAQLCFVDFHGKTDADVTDWLRVIVSREIRRPPQAPSGGRDIETIGPRSPGATELDTIASARPVGPSPAPQPEPQIGSTSAGGSDQPDETASSAETQKKAVDPLATFVDLNVTTPSPAIVTPPASKPKLDVQSFKEYEILSEIARGGMGVVYKARDRKLHRKVALKMILAGQLANPEDIERFYIEAQAAAILRHKNIVGIHQVGEHDGQHYFSMDYIDGKSLADMIADGPMAPHDAARYMRKVAAAIQYAHDLDVLHRDLKPSNVLVDQRDEPLVTDFGLAKRTQQDDPAARSSSDLPRQEGSSMVTMAGSIMGTPGYMPPEQAAGNVKEISARSDVYSLGATLYDLVTGRPPIVGKDAWDTVKRVQQEDPVSPRELNPRVSLDLDAVCMKCLARDPKSRYATAQELADDLQRFLADVPVAARQASRAEHAWRWCRRNPRVASLAALSLMLFITAFAGISLGYVRTRAALADARASIDQMRRAIDTLYTEVSETEALNEPALKPFRRKLLGRARELYDQALKRLGDDPALKEDLAGSQFRLADIARELDSPSDALTILDEARKTQQELLDETPSDIDRIFALGDTVNLRCEILENMGKLKDALADANEAVALRKRLVPPLSPAIKAQLAARAEDPAGFERKLINSQMNSGAIHRALWYATVNKDDKQTHFDSALTDFNDAQDRRHQLLTRLPENARLHQDQAKGYYNLANLIFLPYEELKQEVVAIEDEFAALTDEIERIKNTSDADLGTQNESVAEQLAKLTTRSRKLELILEPRREQAEVHRKRGRDYVAKAINGFEYLLSDHSDKPLDGIEGLELARVKYNLALCFLRKSDFAQGEEVLASMDRARTILDALVQEDPYTYEYGAWYAGVYEAIGNQHFSAFTPEGDAAALKAFDRAIELWKRLPAAQFAQNLQDAERRRAEIQELMAPATAPAPIPSTGDTPTEESKPDPATP